MKSRNGMDRNVSYYAKSVECKYSFTSIFILCYHVKKVQTNYHIHVREFEFYDFY